MTRRSIETVQADSALHLVYEGLLAFKDATGQASTELIPALAESIPTPTNDGKTYVFQIRPNLHYSDGEPVKASDVVNMVKRNLFLGGPFSSFFDDIVGATDYANAKKANAPLKGMIADDATGKLTINLVAPDTRVLYAFAIGESGVGPASKAVFKNTTGNPFPGDGPYTLKVVNPSPTNGEFILTKNPKFDIPTVAKGYVDQIDGMVSTNVNTMTENVINGIARLHDRGPGRRPASAGGAEVQGSVPDRSGLSEHVLLLPEHHDPAVQQPRGAAGGQLRDRQPCARADLRRAAAPDVQPAAAGHGRLQGDHAVPVGRPGRAGQRRQGDSSS